MAYSIKNDEPTNFWRNLSKTVKKENYIDGLEFLLRQAYYSYEIFFGRIAPRRYLKEKLNTKLKKNYDRKNYKIN